MFFHHVSPQKNPPIGPLLWETLMLKAGSLGGTSVSGEISKVRARGLGES